MAEQKSPFTEGSAGQNAFREAYNRLKAEADAARGNITQNYADAYQQLRKQNYAQGLGGAAAQTGLSGGQAGQMGNRVSAAQMGALGNFMQGQEKAFRDQKVGEASIYSNALLEGQQAQQMEREEQQYNYQREEQKKAILDSNDSTDQKIASLKAIGYTEEQARALVSPTVPRQNVIQAAQEQTQASPENPGGATQSWMNLLSGLFG
jgi:hypothetical protein